MKPTSAISKSSNIGLSSSYWHFDLFLYKKCLQINDIKIPDTMLLEKGIMTDWIFNSVKQNNKILRKRKQNLSSLNVVKSFCYKSGHSMAGITTLSGIREELKQIKKQEQSAKDKYLIKEQEKKIEVIASDDQVYCMTLLEFVENVSSENKYGEYLFPENWKIIREKINSSAKIQQFYVVSNVRKNHTIESKCSKTIALNNNDLSTPMNSMDLMAMNGHGLMVAPLPNTNHSPSANAQQQQINTTAPQNKLQEGYKFFDAFLNQKFYKYSQSLIEFIEKNYKCIVEQVTTKFVINKSRQPHLVSVQNLTIKPVKKLVQLQKYRSYAEKGFIRLDEYMKCLLIYIGQNEKNMMMPSLTSISARALSFKCKGSFCVLKVKKIQSYSQKIDNIYSNKNSNNSSHKEQLSNKQLNTATKKVMNELVKVVQKRKHKVIQKLKNCGIIDVDSNGNIFSEGSSSQYEDSEQESSAVRQRYINKNIKVCQNCFFIYMEILKLYDFDPINRSLAEKKKTQHHHIKRRIQSQKNMHLPGISNIRDKSTKFATINHKEQDQQDFETYVKTQRKGDSVFDMANRSKSSRQFNRISPVEQRRNDQQQRLKITLRNKEKLYPNSSRNNEKSVPIFQKNSHQSRKTPIKISLSPILHQPSSKGSRLLALSKSGEQQGSSRLPIGLKNKKSLTKPQNFLQAQATLEHKLSLLPSQSREQFMYFAQKFARDNLPQQIDRKCYSSQYFQNLYSFISNSQINIKPTNCIRKRPQISLKRLSQLTDFPQIVSKSAFHFDTIITDQRTTIPFCIITTQMINGQVQSNNKFSFSLNNSHENIIIIHDIFDSFIEYISLSKDVLQNSKNKRIILFNYPGQSHTIYNEQKRMDLLILSDILDKLLYRLSQEKNQLKMINRKKDKFKLIGMGFGGYLLAQYLAIKNIFNCSNQKSDSPQQQLPLSGVMLVNTYKYVSVQAKEKFNTLYQFYTDTRTSQGGRLPDYAYYNKIIESTQTGQQSLEYKSCLNPIRRAGRLYLLASVLGLAEEAQNNYHNPMMHGFENFQGLVYVVYGNSNALFTKSHARSFLISQDTNLAKEQIKNRKFIELQAGHDIVTDDYEGMQQIIKLFIEQ